MGMRSVTSSCIPTRSGADEAKKNPPRETFSASVKCSLRIRGNAQRAKTQRRA